MKYTLALALALFTAATQAVSHNELKQALFNLDLSTVEQFIATNTMTQAEKERYLTLAEEIKKPYLSSRLLRLSHKDTFRMSCGAVLCGASLTSFALSGATGLATLRNFAHRRSVLGMTTSVVSLTTFAAASAAAYYGIRHIVRGYSNYAAKEDIRKILSIIDLLKTVEVQP